MAQPNLNQGLEYWEKQPATVDGVLGGYGNGALPRVDAFSSRLFLLSVLPRLCTVPSPLSLPNLSEDSSCRIRALDVGAGVGRVTKDVLLHMVDTIVLLEPVQPLIEQAVATSQDWKGIASKEKSVIFIKKPLQQFDPTQPIAKDDIFAHVGSPIDEKEDTGYDVVWCQWCLGHLRDKQLVHFFKQAKSSLRPEGVIIVKENCCPETRLDEPKSVYDPEDSSLTRSHTTWLALFEKAGLKLLRHELQKGFPEELYDVRSYALV